MNNTSTILSIVKETIFKHPLVFLLMVIGTAGSVVLTIIPPLVLASAVDALTSGTAITLSLTVLYFGLLVMYGIVSSLQQTMIIVFGQKITHALRSRMYKKLERLPASYFVMNESGAIASKIVSDADTVEALFSSGIIEMVSDLASVISILVMIFVKAKGLGLVMLVVLPAIFYMTFVFQNRMKKAQLKQRKAIERENADIPETRHIIRSIKVFHSEKYMLDRYDGYLQDGYDAMEKNNFYDSVYSPIIITISSAIIAMTVCLAGAGGTFQSFFGMSAGTAVAIISYISGVFTPIESIGMEIQSIQSAIAGVERINEFMSEEERKPGEKTTEEDKENALEAEDVSFAYDGGNDIYHGLNLNIKAGENVVIMGRTGSGKSTLFRLILGLYIPQKGSIKIFGRDASSITEEEKRKMFGYVEQTFHPVLGTIKEQITMQDRSITDEMIQDALITAGLKDVIDVLPEGIQTEYSDALFSQGQRQLLSIARAIVSDPKILLLDEMTASLDSNTEKELMDALHKASQHRTVISISHRLFEDAGIRRIDITAHQESI